MVGRKHRPLVVDARPWANLRWQAAVAALCGCLLIVMFHFDAFAGRALVPYDAITDNFPWYYNALRSFRENPFLNFNPYKLGGVQNYHLLAFYDPLYWPPLLLGSDPGLYEHQLLNLAHLFRIPVALVTLARLYGASGARLLAVAPLALVAAFVGPTLRYRQHSEALDMYCWGFLALAAGEWFRLRGGLRPAVVAALSLAFAFIRYPAAAVFWPLFFVPYALLCRREFLAHRGARRDLTLAAAAGACVVAPNVVHMQHFLGSLEPSYIQGIANELARADGLALLGLTANANISLVAVPTIVSLLAAGAIARAPRPLAIFYLALFAVLVAYAFGQLTPFFDLFRRVYPPAAIFRRPYATFHVVLPILFGLAVRTLARETSPIPPRAVPLAGATVGGATLALVLERGADWRPIALGAACTLGALAALALARPSLRPALVGGAIVAQWAVLCYAPFVASHWAPQPVTKALPRAVAYDLLEPYRSLQPFMAPRGHAVPDLYRIVSIGLPAEFGPYSAIFGYYNLAADYSTRFPQELIRKSGIAQPYAGAISQYMLEHPELIGSAGLRELGVRYYFFNPDIYAKLKPVIFARDGTLREVASGGHWNVVEDSGYLPFVTSIDAAGVPRGPVAATIGSNRVAFTVPDGGRWVDLSFIYDRWWRLTDEEGTNLSDRVVSDGGQLRVDTAGLGGRKVTLDYGNRPFSVAVVANLLAYLAMLLGALGAILHRSRGRLLRGGGDRTRPPSRRSRGTVRAG